MVSNIPLLPLTFGVELEFLFAINPHEIEKDPKHFLYETSVAVQGSDIYVSDYEWLDEGKCLNYVAEILRRANLTRKIQNVPHQTPDFTVWQLTHDRSVVPYFFNPRNLFPTRITSEDSMQWRYDGVEVVSRILEATGYEGDYLDAEPFREIERYLTALTPAEEDPWLISSTKETGFHVHIGTDPNSSGREIRLPILQHLAYILARYEEIISSFHSEERRGYMDTASDGYATSNLILLRGNPHCCGQFPLPALTEIQDRIFAPNMCYRNLIRLMDGMAPKKELTTITRYKFVNFEHFYSFPGYFDVQPRTVEFRQHEGTFNIEDIAQWVCFLTTLVRTAERHVNADTPPDLREGSKYHFTATTHAQKATELFDLLQLPPNAREYWMRRYAKYNPKTAEKRPNTEICRQCKKDFEAESRRPRRPRHLAESPQGVEVEECAPEDSGSGKYPTEVDEAD